MRSLLILSLFGISHAWQPADRTALKSVIDACVVPYQTADGSECYACADGTPKTSSTESCTDGSTPQFISDWDTSLVTDFNTLFISKHAFNQPIGNWDTSQSTSFKAIFLRANAFNQSLANWNTAKATDMEKMFYDALAFNKPIGNWDTSEVTTMKSMFYGFSEFNQPLNSWDVSKVTDMETMLFRTNFDQDLSSWNTGSVTNARLMFSTTPFNQDISSWDMSKNTRFDGMFRGLPGDGMFNGRPRRSQFNQDISTWNVSNGIRFDEMFEDSSFNQDISSWNVANGKIFIEMFKNSPFDQDLPCWDISSGTQFQNMFENSQMSHTLCWDLSDISSVYTADMFKGTTGSVDDTCTATGCTVVGEACSADSDCRSGICSGTCLAPCQAEERLKTTTSYNERLGQKCGYTDYKGRIGHANYEGSASTSDYEIHGFSHDSGGKFSYSPSSDSDAIQLQAAKDACNDNAACKLIIRRLISGTKYFYFQEDICSGEYNTNYDKFEKGEETKSCVACEAGKTSAGGTATTCTDIPTIGDACTSDADCNEKLKCINSVCTQVWEPWKPADRDALRALIGDCVAFGSYNSNTQEYEGGGDGSECYACTDGTHKTSSTAYCEDGSKPQFISDWDVSQVTDFSSLFSSRHQFNQPLANWETSQVTSMYKTFNLATDFNQPLNSWDVSSVTNMGDMFSSTYDFNQPLDTWDTSNVNTMERTFISSGFNQPLNSWNTSSVTDMEKMFWMASAFNQPLDSWNTAKVATMKSMFEQSIFNGDVSTWDTSSVTDFHAMFFKTPFNQDISQWDVSSGTTFLHMFSSNLVFNQDISTWDVSKGRDFRFMFKGLSSSQKSAFNQDLSCWDIGNNLPWGNINQMFENSAMTHTLCWTGKDRLKQMVTSYPPFEGTTASINTTCTAPCTSTGEACTADSECVSGVCTDSLCAPNTCAENQRASGGACVACPAGKTNAAGDSVASDSTCDPTLCDEDHHVVNHVCQPCALGTKPAGDDASKGDTTCDVGPCGGLTCVRGTCVNDVCECPLGYSGMTCDKDVTAAGKLAFLQSKRKNNPTRDDIKDMQKDIRTFVRDTLKKALLTKTVKEALQDTKILIERSDLKQSSRVVVLQLNKQPALAVASENKDTDDTCKQGVNSARCSMLDIKENPDEIIFLNTQEEVGSWSVLNSGDKILSKQTKVSEDVYDMQCWNNTDWSEKVRFDTTSNSDLYECNDHLILIGSQAAVCTDDTCKNGGTCTPDGYSFTCTCAAGYTGDSCENQATITHCHQMDCSDYGGHKAGECTDCNVANCCNYATKTLFNNHCDGLTATKDFVEAKCCHRTFCI